MPKAWMRHSALTKVKMAVCVHMKQMVIANAIATIAYTTTAIAITVTVEILTQITAITASAAVQTWLSSELRTVSAESSMLACSSFAKS
jgi:hypothetical protein